MANFLFIFHGRPCNLWTTIQCELSILLYFNIKEQNWMYILLWLFCSHDWVFICFLSCLCLPQYMSLPCSMYVYISPYLCLCLRLCKCSICICLSVCISMHVSTCFYACYAYLCLPQCMLLFVSACLFVCLYVNLCLPLCISLYVSACLYVCLCLPQCLSNSVSAYIYVCLCLFLYMFLYVCHVSIHVYCIMSVFVQVSVHLLSCRYLLESIYACLYVTLCLCACISVSMNVYVCLCLPLPMPMAVSACLYVRVCLYVCVFVCLKFGSISNFLDNRVGDSCAGGGFCSRGRGNTLRGRLWMKEAV